eukprot:TRINITY_DN3469_c0_g1_i5.p1 TRINITY_DN3469_c0_g1~~TRINITY_DN3469_c0_g1_i5.p1  ORF type:complete len:168 (+),score=16.69 TRINITY_DN3469_c0_g1_i5:245-748(+)
MHKFDFFNSLNEETAEKYKADLRDMIYQLLTKNKYQFYQGYDEFCCVLLLILGKKQGIKAATTASKFFLKDFLRDSFEDKVKPMLFMVNDIVKAAEAKLHESFVKIGVVQPVSVDADVLSPLDSDVVCAQHTKSGSGWQSLCLLHWHRLSSGPRLSLRSCSLAVTCS